MLSFESGTPIAHINGGRHNGRTLYADDSLNISHTSILSEDELRSFVLGYCLSRKERRDCIFTPKEMDVLIHSIKYDEAPRSDKMRVIFTEVKQEMNNRMNREFRTVQGLLEPITDPISLRETVCAFGASGVGKTTFISNLIKSYTDTFPNRKVYLFTRKEYLDPVFKDLSINKIDVFSPLFLAQQFTLEDFKKSLVVFDDITNFPDKRIEKEIHRIRDDILENGRQLKITCYCTNHQIFNRGQTNKLIKEVNKFIIFIQDDRHHIKKFLKENIGCSSDDVKRIISLPTRWVLISRMNPKYVMYESGCYIL
jgi:hypothetical protein